MRNDDDELYAIVEEIPEQKCSCGHWETDHYFNGILGKSIFCLNCDCMMFEPVGYIEDLGSFCDQDPTIELNNIGDNMPEKWEKIEDNIFKFENVGDSVEGRLVKKEIGQLYGNEVYHIKTKDGVKVVFGTTVLQSRMSSIDKGEKVRIIYTGSQPNKKRGQEDIKLFDVFVSK